MTACVRFLPKWFIEMHLHKCLSFLFSFSIIGNVREMQSHIWQITCFGCDFGSHTTLHGTLDLCSSIRVWPWLQHFTELDLLNWIEADKTCYWTLNTHKRKQWIGVRQICVINLISADRRSLFPSGLCVCRLTGEVVGGPRSQLTRATRVLVENELVLFTGSACPTAADLSFTDHLQRREEIPRDMPS